MSRGKTWNKRWYKADMFNMKYCQARHTTNGTKIVVLHSPNAKREGDWMQRERGIGTRFWLYAKKEKHHMTVQNRWKKKQKRQGKEIRIVSAEKKHNKLLCWT